MSKEINLLKRKKNAIFNAEKIELYLKITAVILPLLLITVSLVLFYLQTQSPLYTLKKQESALFSNLSLSSTKTVKLLLIQNRIKDINGIIEKRTDFDKKIAVIINTIPDGVSITSITVNKNSFSLSASSNSLLTIDIFLNTLINMAVKEKSLGKVMFSGLTANTKDASYSFSIQADML